MLNGNYLICNSNSDKNTEVKKQIRFNLDAYYKDAMKSDIETVKEKIAQEILNKSADTEIDDVLSTNKYEDMKSHLMIRAINFLRNSVRLEDAIYSRFGDMAICAYLKVSDKNGQFMSVKIKYVFARSA